jgi:hypothetical protein
VNINSNANGANSAVNNLAVDGTGRAYVINPDTSVTKPLGAVAIYDGDNLVQERQVGGTPIALFNGANGDVYAVVALYEDRGGTVQRVVSVYDVTNDSSLGEAYVRPFAGSEDLTDAAVGTDGRIYVTNPDDQTVVVVGGSTPIEMGGTPVGLAVNPDDGRVYAIVSHPAPDSAATLKLVEIKNDGTTVDLGDVYTTPANSGQYASYSDIAVRGDRVYVTNVGDPLALGSGSISVLDADTGAQLTPIGLGSNPFASTKPIRVVISPDGEHAYVVTESGYVSEISFADTADSAVNV